MDVSRRLLLFAGAAVAAGCGRSTPTQPRLSDSAEPLPPVEDGIGMQEDKYGAVAGVFAVNLNSGRTLAYRDDDMFAVCST